MTVKLTTKGQTILPQIKSLVRRTLFTTGVSSLARLMRPQRFNGCRVISFHRVVPDEAGADYYARQMGEPTVSELDAILQHLRRWFRFITPRELFDAISGQRQLDPYTLILTFDDGYKDVADRLVPLLNRLQIPAAIFVNTGALHGDAVWFQKLFAAIIDTPLETVPDGFGIHAMPLRTVSQRVDAINAFSRLHHRSSPEKWDALLPRICRSFRWNGDLRDEQMMSWDDLLRAARSPWISVGGHSVSHPYLPNCDDRRLKCELVECANELRDRLQLDFLPFSYPNGGSDDRVVKAVMEAGYECSFSMVPGLNSHGVALHGLHRQYVAPDVVGAAFDLSFRCPLGRPVAAPIS